MTSDVHAALVRIQRRVVEHYNHLLRQRMSDAERRAIEEKLGREQRLLSEFITGPSAAR